MHLNGQIASPLMNRKLHFLLFLMPLSVLGQNYTLYSDQSYHTISGVSQNLLNLDVFVPNSGETPKPVMVYIHGGSWSVGDKSAVGSKAEWFTDSNYVFVSINYRLSPEPADTLDANRIKFPDHSDDVGKAMAWVIENIGNYQGDTSRISVIGHSAGAHLALLVSTDPSYLNNEGYGLSKIKCSCALDAGAHHINYYMENYIIPYNQTVQWLTYVNAFTSDPTIWSQASPYTYLQANAGIPELLLVHQGTAQRIDLNQHFGTQAEAMGIPVTYFNADPMTHEQINQALGHDTAVSV
ncbi:MAG: hypothetical protein RL266_569, partial [Bacteroidota bacterium]